MDNDKNTDLTDNIEDILEDSGINETPSNEAGTKSKVVPAYMNKSQNSEQENFKSKKGKNKKVVKDKKMKKGSNKKSKIIILIIIAILLIAGIITTILILSNKIDYEKYYQYEEKMNMYGFSPAYDNQSAATKESVTKSEAIKLVLAVVLNTNDITPYGYGDLDEEYKNEHWVNFAKSKNIISQDDINEENAQDKVTYEELLKYFINAKTNLLEKNPDTSVTPTFKNYGQLNSNQQLLLADMVTNKILENNKEKIKMKQNICKGMLNEIATKYAVEFNTITIGDDKININPDKVPNNVNDYPYTLSNVDKKVYEYEFDKVENSIGEYKTPVQAFAENKQYYSQIKEIVENYYNLILNVDYTTIDADTLKESIDEYVATLVSRSKTEEYVKYVKDNAIKITGTAKVQLPVIYNDGSSYRVRVKLEFEKNSGYVDNNLLYLDFLTDSDITYEGDKYVAYIDAQLTNVIFGNLYYMQPMAIYDQLLNKDTVSIKSNT